MDLNEILRIFFCGLLLGFGYIFGGVYRGSFRIDFLGFRCCFSVGFFFLGYFLGIFSEVLGFFLH